MPGLHRQGPHLADFTVRGRVHVVDFTCGGGPVRVFPAQLVRATMKTQSHAATTNGCCSAIAVRSVDLRRCFNHWKSTRACWACWRRWLIIWIGFQVASGGLFLTPRNLWNLSVQSTSIAIMATGMVLVIVSRNIDLSVGSVLGFLGYTMAMVQTQWIPNALHLGFNQPYTWLIAVAVGVAIGAAIGLLQGSIIAYGGVPAFIVTLGGFLVWRGLIFGVRPRVRTLAPMGWNLCAAGWWSKRRTGRMGNWMVGAPGLPWAS